jgi:hypothetical protein
MHYVSPPILLCDHGNVLSCDVLEADEDADQQNQSTWDGHTTRSDNDPLKEVSPWAFPEQFAGSMFSMP